MRSYNYKNGLGSGDNGEFTFLDILGIISFFVGIMNLNENLNQGDKQELLEKFSEEAERLLNEIHLHLQEQDEKIDKILKELEYDS